jgi:hypothetical protein
MTVNIPDELGYAELHLCDADDDGGDHLGLAVAYALVDIAKSLRTLAGRDHD